MTRTPRSSPLVALLAGALQLCLPAWAEPERRAGTCPQPAARERLACWEARLMEVLDREGPRAAMLALEEAAAGDPEVRREGHTFAHHIGIAAFTTEAEVADIFVQCTPSFQSGCYHGVIQAYFADRAARGRAPDEEAVTALCAPFAEGGSDLWLLFQCLHGLGHGLALIADNDLPAALAGCDLLPDEWQQEACYGGAFMEVVVNVTHPHHTSAAMTAGGGHFHGGHHHDHHHEHHNGGEQHEPAHAHHGDHHEPHELDRPPVEPRPEIAPAADSGQEDPFSPCDALAEHHRPHCWLMQTSAILFHKQGDFAATFRICNQLAPPERNACYRGLGRDINAYTDQDHDEAARLCALGDPENRSWCHAGVAKNLVDLSADARAGLFYCATLSVPTERASCFHAVGEQIGVLTAERQEREELCGLAEGEDRSSCRRGALLERGEAPGGS